MIRLYLDAFWEEAFWLPTNVTWKDIEPSPGKSVTYTNSQHILLAIPLGLVFILLRFILNKYVFAQFGEFLGIQCYKNKKALLIPKLEAAYKTNATSNKICALAKQLDMSEQQVARWWRLRRAQDKPTTLVKFCDTAWRFTFYFYNFWFGVFALWNKDWLWDIDQCFVGYPHQGITQDVWWYYMVAAAFYWSVTFTVFWDPQRKDFWQIVIHHFTTIGLLSVSWVCNLHRIGTLIMLSHDPVEFLLEIAKAGKYAGYQKFCDRVFIVFTFTWPVAKLGIYPFYIIRRFLRVPDISALLQGACNSAEISGTLKNLYTCITFTAPMYMDIFPAFKLLISLCYVLLALYIYWTCLISQMAYKTLQTGKIERDIRSSSSDSDSSQSDHDTPGDK